MCRKGWDDSWGRQSLRRMAIVLELSRNSCSGALLSFGISKDIFERGFEAGDRRAGRRRDGTFGEEQILSSGLRLAMGTGNRVRAPSKNRYTIVRDFIRGRRLGI